MNFNVQLQQFKDLSSWREDTLTVKAKSVGTLDFMDTKPNQFVIQNGNHYPVYIGIGSTPNSKNYEFKIGANSNDVFGRPTPTSKVMFYNDSDMDIVVRVFSIFQEFDIITLKNMTASIQNATVVTDGIVRGFEQGVKLPSGDNLIGRVKLSQEDNDDLKSVVQNVNTVNESIVGMSGITYVIKQLVSTVSDTLTDFKNSMSDLLSNMNGNITYTGDRTKVIAHSYYSYNDITRDWSLFPKRTTSGHEMGMLIDSNDIDFKSYFYELKIHHAHFINKATTPIEIRLGMLQLILEVGEEVRITNTSTLIEKDFEGISSDRILFLVKHPTSVFSESDKFSYTICTELIQKEEFMEVAKQ